MGETTGIAWTDHTFNPWIGCQRVSPGCQHCYAETLNKRWGDDNWGKNAERRVTSDSNWRLPERWNRQAAAEGKRHRVFCASMADVFEDNPQVLEARDRLFALIATTPWLDWQLLTKRPENVLRLTEGYGALDSNVWIGCTAEDQEHANTRIQELARIPASVRFLSCEPLLGPIDLSDVLGLIDWVIVGGESGPGARPMHVDWARTIRDDCYLQSVPFFFKQWGGVTAKAGGKQLDGREWCEFPESKVTV